MSTPRPRVRHIGRPSPDRDYATVGALLDEIKRRERLRNEYQLAKFMGWSTSKLGNWRKGRSLPSDKEAHHIADVLKLNGLYVLGVVRAEREQDAPVKELWRYLTRITRNLAPLTVAALALVDARPAPASTPEARAASVYSVKRRIRRGRAADRRRRRPPRRRFRELAVVPA